MPKPAWFSKSLCPRKPEGSLGRTAQVGHLDSHTAPELWCSAVVPCSIYAKSASVRHRIRLDLIRHRRAQLFVSLVSRQELRLAIQCRWHHWALPAVVASHDHHVLRTLTSHKVSHWHCDKPFQALAYDILPSRKVPESDARSEPLTLWQTSSTGLRHPSFKEGAGKRWSEWAHWHWLFR